MLHTSGRPSKVPGKAVTRLRRMRLRRLLVAAALLALSPSSAWAAGRRVVARPDRADEHEGQRRPPAPGARVGRHRSRRVGRERHRRGRRRAHRGRPSGAAVDRVELDAGGAGAAVAVGTRALVLLHAQQGSGATLVAAAVTGPAVGGPEQAAATTAPITEAAAALHADGSALAVYAVAQTPMVISSAARGGRRLGAGRRPCAAGEHHDRAATAPLRAARRRRRPDVPRAGPPAGRRSRPFTALRSATGVWSAPVSLDPTAVVACSDLGLVVDAAGNAYAVWSVSDGRVRTSLLPAGGGFTPASPRRPRRARRASRSLRRAGPCCWPGSTWPGPSCAPPSGRPPGSPRLPPPRCP